MKKISFIVSIITVLFFGVSCLVYGAIIANDLADPYPGGKLMEQNVTDGAAFFLQAQVNITNLLWEGEIGSKDKLNVYNCICYIDGAIQNLNLAKEKIMTSITISKTAAPDISKISMLKSFDYDRLIIDKALNREIMMEVKALLVIGDIPGFYQKFVDGLSDIAKNLQTMKEKLNANIQPSIDEYWYLVNKTSYISLFGNYGTVVGQTAIK